MKKKEDKLGSAEIWIDGELIKILQISVPSQLWRVMEQLPNNSTVICKWTNGKQKTFKVSR